MGKRAIDPYIRAQVVALYNNGKISMTMDEVAGKLNISKCCVFNAIQKYKKTGEYVDKKRSGRPKRLDERDQRYLKRLVKGENRLSVSKITRDLNQSLSEPISSRSVFNYLKKLGYEYKVKLKKQWLSAKHRKERVAWCQKYAHFSKSDWRNVIFSDESTFYVLERKNQVKIWRTDEERLHQGCIQQMNTGKAGKVGIWGGISGHGATEARVFDENMNGHLYCDVLNKELKRSMNKLQEKDRLIFQQDLAPWHTSKIVAAKMKKMKIKVLDWPAKSPDLNPVELVWSILDKKLMVTPIYNKTTLRQRLEEEWKAVGIELCCSLVDSMPDRLEKCLRAKGGHFT